MESYSIHRQKHKRRISTSTSNVEKTILDVVSLIASQEGIWFDGDNTLSEALITAYRFSPESMEYSLEISSL